jgi:hypothetical protein
MLGWGCDDWLGEYHWDLFSAALIHDDFRSDTVVVHHSAQDGEFRTALDPTYIMVCITVCNKLTILYVTPFYELAIEAHPSICQCVG